MVAMTSIKLVMNMVMMVMTEKVMITMTMILIRKFHNNSSKNSNKNNNIDNGMYKIKTLSIPRKCRVEIELVCC